MKTKLMKKSSKKWHSKMLPKFCNKKMRKDSRNVSLKHVQRSTFDGQCCLLTEQTSMSACSCLHFTPSLVLMSARGQLSGAYRFDGTPVPKRPPSSSLSLSLSLLLTAPPKSEL